MRQSRREHWGREKKLGRNRLPHARFAQFHWARPDHMRVESSCCFPRELVSFDPRYVQRFPPIRKRIWVGKYNIMVLQWLFESTPFSCNWKGVFSVFISHVIKTKNRNHSINKVNNLGYDRWLICKQPRQESGLCCVFSFASYLQKCVTQIWELCAETPCLCPSEGHKHGGRTLTETSVTEFCYWKKKIFL